MLLALADIEGSVSYVQIRVDQALRRTGLYSLLVPAQEELVLMTKDVADAKTQVLSAVERLME